MGFGLIVFATYRLADRLPVDVFNPKLHTNLHLKFKNHSSNFLAYCDLESPCFQTHVHTDAEIEVDKDLQI